LFRSLTDEELVIQIVKTKNTVLFEELYDRYSKVVYNKCLGFSKNEAEAKDLTQDVFIRLFVKLGSFKGNSKFSTWLYALTYNYCVNYVNRNASKKIEKNAVRFDDLNMDLMETSKSSLFELKVDKLEKALELIAPEDKMILLLKYQDEMPVSEISKILLIGKSAVKMRLKRARGRVINVCNKMVIILWTILLKK
jgi:RNA polymerase sigma-70 factor (ECF subfamily)